MLCLCINGKLLDWFTWGVMCAQIISVTFVASSKPASLCFYGMPLSCRRAGMCCKLRGNENDLIACSEFIVPLYQWAELHAGAAVGVFLPSPHPISCLCVCVICHTFGVPGNSVKCLLPHRESRIPFTFDIAKCDPCGLSFSFFADWFLLSKESGIYLT